MSSPEIPQPHDSLVRYTFGQLQHAASFFRENLSATLASAVRWDELKLLGDSFVDEQLRHAETDLLYQVPLHDPTEGADGVVVDWAFPLLAEADRAKIGPDSMLPLYRYLLTVTGLNKEEFRAKLARSAISTDTTQSIMTLADQLISEGLLKGREEGALIGQVQTLQRLLGRAPDPLSALAGMPKEQLESMAARLERELGERLK
jgi:hypothetical protein